MRRVFDPAIPEWMDRPQPVSAELKSDLANLALLNRWFGSYSLVRKLTSKWLLPGKSYRLLDFATASADIPRMLVLWARQRGIQLTIDAVDFMEATLEVAGEWSKDFPEIRLIRGDIRNFKATEVYDGVLCSLALHHFSEEDAVTVLRNMLENSADWTVVADLERSRFAQFCIWAITAVWLREKMTRDDARMSIRRAFSFREFRGLTDAAGWTNAQQARFPVARQAIWLRRG